MRDTTQIFTILFLMLGPFKIIGPFAKMTQNATPELARRIAIRAILFSSISLLVAALVGQRILSNFVIPIPILAMSGGIILFLVALLFIIQQFNMQGPEEKQVDAPTLKMAIYPLAFPTIVTPYGIAAVIVFFSLIQDTKDKLLLAAIVVGIMLLNLVIMLLNRYIFKYVAVILPLLGAILGVVQVALGLQIIYKMLLELIRLNQANPLQ